jgi:tetratricopeptide (TPR) repeat protein
MEKRPNVKLILILLGVVASLGLGVHLLHRVQVVRSARGLLTRSRLAEKQGRADRAEDYLSRYLVYRPDDVDAMFRYGVLLDKHADSEEQLNRALRVYKKAVQLEADRKEIRRRLVDLAMRLSRSDPQMFATAKTHAEVLLKDSPEDGELMYILGVCEESRGRFREAAELYEKARHQDSARIDSYVRLARLLRDRMNEPTRADRVMEPGSAGDDLVSANGKSAAAYLERARYRRKYALPKVDPEADVARALELAPDNSEVLLAAAESALQKGKVEAARKSLQRGIELDKLNPAMYQGLADLELQQSQTESAANWLRKGVEALRPGPPDQRVGLAWSLADSLIRAGHLEEADKVMADLESSKVRPELLEYLKASRLVARKKWPEAARALRALQPALGAASEFQGLTKRSLILLGLCYQRLGNLDQRYDAYRRAVTIDLSNDPMWTTARMGLASALADLNRIDEALEQYRIALAKEPRAGLALTRLQVVRNLNRTTGERNWQEIGRTLDAVEQRLMGLAGSEPASAEATVLRAEVLAAQGQFSSARQLLEQALAKYPNQVDIWVTLANLAGREGKPEETLSRLDEAQKRVGDLVELRLARAGYWVRRGGSEAPGALTKLEDGAESFSAEDRALLFRNLATALSRIGSKTQALNLWKRLVQEQPDDLDSRIGLFNETLLAGDEAAASLALAQVRRVEGEDGSVWRYGKALLLVRKIRSNPADRSPLIEIRRELSLVAAQRPSWPRVVLVMAEVEQLDGHVDAAIQNYLRAILELGERDPVAVGRALQLLNQQQRLAEAAQVVQKLRDEQIPLSGDLQRTVAQFSLQSGDTGRALELARQSVSELSTNPADLIWLGQVEWANGKDAGPAFRRAVALDGRSPEARLALIVYLARTGRKAEAEAALQEAEPALTGGRASLALAQGYEEVGHPERAEVIYTTVLKESPDDVTTLRSVATYYLRGGRPAEAQKHLDRIIRLGGTTTDATWARRMLATVTAATGGNPRQALKALEILGLAEGGSQGRDLRLEAPDDLRTKAKILAMQPGVARRREAITILESLLARKVGTAEDLFLLAQLFEGEGDWPKARERLLELLNVGGKNPNYLAHYVRALLRHDRAEEAKAYLAAIEQLAPGQAGTVEIKARVLAAQRKYAEVDALLTNLARADVTRLEPVALLLEELGRSDAAESLLREYVAKVGSGRPEAVLAFAGFLGRQGRTKEALEKLDDQAWRTLPPGTIANATLSILFHSKSDATHSERAAQRLEGAIRAHPDEVSIQFGLANVRILQGRYAEAESILRAVYERDKAKGTPLNNLAWLLALRGSNGSEALALVQRAIELEGETPDLLDTRALAYLKTDQADAAIRDLEDAVTVDPSGEKYFHLARAYQLAGRRREASEALRKAKEARLTAETLHPLERDSYNELLGLLARR